MVNTSIDLSTRHDRQTLAAMTYTVFLRSTAGIRVRCTYTGQCASSETTVQHTSLTSLTSVTHKAHTQFARAQMVVNTHTYARTVGGGGGGIDKWPLRIPLLSPSSYRRVNHTRRHTTGLYPTPRLPSMTKIRPTCLSPITHTRTDMTSSVHVGQGYRSRRRRW